jgi:hypothetical protein
MAAHPRHRVPGAKKGRPSKYNPAYCAIVKKMVRLGATTIEVAAALDMPVHRVYAWRAAYQEFSDSFKIAMTTPIQASASSATRMVRSRGCRSWSTCRRKPPRPSSG